MTFLAAAFTVTAYAVGCGAAVGSLTRAGTHPVAGFTIAADRDVLPLGTIVEIEGLGGPFMVHDTGSAVRGRHVDLFLGSCHAARKWGRRSRRVRVLHVGGRKP